MKKIIFFLLLCCTIAATAQTPSEIVKITRGRLSPRTGQAGQTAVGQNILLSTAGTGSFDLTGTADSANYNWIALQITTSGTTSSGVVTFEGSNDNTTFYSTPLINAQAVHTTSVGVASVTASISSAGNRSWYGQVPYRYFRARISTTIGGGGSIGAAYILNYSDNPTSVVASVGSTLLVQSSNTTGNVANSSAASGSPLTVAGRAQTGHVTNDIVNNDVATLLMDINNKAVFRPYAIGNNTFAYATLTGGINNSTAALTISPAQGAGIRNALTGLQVSIPAALSGTTELVIRDGASGTVLWRGSYGAATIGSWHYDFPSPIRGTANTLLEVACTSAVTGAIVISAQGFFEY